MWIVVTAVGISIESLSVRVRVDKGTRSLCYCLMGHIPYFSELIAKGQTRFNRIEKQLRANRSE